MEPDSTTFESSSNGKFAVHEIYLPFTTFPGNYKLYKELVFHNGEGSQESQIIQRLQKYGLLQESVKCPADLPTCNVISKRAKVIDRMQWVCEGCGKRQPIRTNSFFYRLQCSILQTLQLILAWCEDVDINLAAQHFDVKPKVVHSIFDRLDELAIRELKKDKLGGENAVVLAEMYPDCLNRLSPDTTDQPHVHRILMLADTKHIPTDYRLHVIREDSKRQSVVGLHNYIKTQIEEVTAGLIEPNSTLVTGNYVPAMDGTSSLQQLQQYCDSDMHNFLSSRIWRQAISLCAASRSLCAASVAGACSIAVQRYLDASLYRIKQPSDGFYQHVLTIIADEFRRSDVAVTCNAYSKILHE